MAAAVVAQPAHRIKVRRVPFPDVAAVAGKQRQFLGKRAAKALDQGFVMAQILKRARQMRRRVGRSAIDQNPAQFGGQDQPVADRGEVARAAAPDGQPRQCALQIGRAAQGGAQILAHPGLIEEIGQAIVAAFDFRPVGERRRQACRQQARAAAGDGAVDGRQQASRTFAVQGADQFQVPPRRLIDFHDGAGLHPARRRDPGHLADLGQRDIVEQGARGADLGAAEVAECVQRRDLKMLLQPLLGIQRVEQTVGLDGKLGLPVGEEVEQVRFLCQPVRGQQLARMNPGKRRRDRGEVQRLGMEAAGGNVEPGERQRLSRPRQRGQIVVRARVEQRVLGQGAGGDQADHIARDHRFRAALLGFGGVFGLFADRDTEALADQARQIGLGGMHRHAAHRNVLTRVMAALGQGDVQRRRRRDRVVEEQFVEIAHPVEQQTVRIGLLDREVLRHHRGRLVTRALGRFSPPRRFLGSAVRHGAGEYTFAPVRQSVRTSLATSRRFGIPL